MPFARSAFVAATLGVGVTLAGALPAEAAPVELPAAVALPTHHGNDTNSNNGGGNNGGSSCAPFCTPSPSTHMGPHQHPQTEKLARQIITYVRARIAEHHIGSGGNNSGGSSCAPVCTPSPSAHLKSR